MADRGHAGVEGSLGLGRGRLRVPRAQHDAPPAGARDELEGARKLRRERHHRHPTGVEEPVEQRDVGIPAVRARVRPEPPRRDERPLEVRADDGRARRHRPQGVDERLLRRGHERRLEGGHARREQRLAGRTPLGGRRAEEVDAREAVHLEVDEAGRREPPPAASEPHPGDPPAVELDVADHELVADERGFDAEPQIGSGRPLAIDRFAASDTRSAPSACSPVPSAGRRPASRHETKYASSGPHGSALSTGSTRGSPSTG